MLNKWFNKMAIDKWLIDKMKLVINGNGKNLNCNTVSELVNHLNLQKDMVAVELNKNIVHRENFEKTNFLIRFSFLKKVFDIFIKLINLEI